MTPWLQDADVTLYHGDVMAVLPDLPAESVDCVVTSPPFWGLRDYGTATWEGGDVGCDHKSRPRMSPTSNIGRSRGKDARLLPDAPSANVSVDPYGDICGKCGATRIDQQLGLEPTPEQYVERMVEVFREVRRVLAPHGTVWLNLGSSFANKQEQMIPAKVALALQAPYYTGKIKDERERMWLAATVEAEGCMFIHRRKGGTPNYAKFTRKDGTEVSYDRKQDTFGAGLEVASTDRVIVERCMEIAGIGSINEQSPEQNPRRKQTIYRWHVRSNECKWIIRELYPHFIAKQHEARLLLGCPSKGDDARKAWESLKALHQGQTASMDFAPPEGMWERGWFLRSEIIWAKCIPNPMPESVTDRPTKSHEQIFLLSKQPRYFFDQEAVREAYQPTTLDRDRYSRNLIGKGVDPSGASHTKGPDAPQVFIARGPDGRRKTTVQGADGSIQHRDGERWPNGGRNIRSVWEIATQPYPEAHFATFPEELARRCIAAGCPEQVCRVCGKARERIVETTHDKSSPKSERDFYGDGRDPGVHRKLGGPYRKQMAAGERISRFTDCGCWIEPSLQEDEPLLPSNYRPGIVLDPFIGSGTVAHVARKLGRHAVGIDLSESYLKLAARRLQQQSLFSEVAP